MGCTLHTGNQQHSHQLLCVSITIHCSHLVISASCSSKGCLLTLILARLPVPIVMLLRRHHWRLLGWMSLPWNSPARQVVRLAATLWPLSRYAARQLAAASWVDRARPSWGPCCTRPLQSHQAATAQGVRGAGVSPEPLNFAGQFGHRKGLTVEDHNSKHPIHSKSAPGSGSPMDAAVVKAASMRLLVRLPCADLRFLRSVWFSCTNRMNTCLHRGRWHIRR